MKPIELDITVTEITRVFTYLLTTKFLRVIKRTYRQFSTTIWRLWKRFDWLSMV